jgi:hypothetical protein
MDESLAFDCGLGVATPGAGPFETGAFRLRERGVVGGAFFAATFLAKAVAATPEPRRAREMIAQTEEAARDPAIPSSWLTERTTVEEAEARHTVAIDGSPTPFGYNASAWARLKNRMRPGDEIWNFVSPAESWRALAGRMGVALVRKGVVIDHIVTLMN